MKHQILSALAAIVLFASCSKTASDTTMSSDVIVPGSSVPSSVVSGFTADNSKASELEWRKGTDDKFKVHFNADDKRVESKLDDNGRTTASRVVSDKAVPKAVLDAFAANFPGETVYEWKLRSDGTWRAHFNRSGVKWEATFSASGTLLKAEKSA